MTNSGSSDRYRLVESVYQRAADVPRAERGRFLREACGEDDALAERRADVDAVPERIGSYTIVGLLGRGGMGAVYEARQAQPARRVALKMIRADAVSHDALRRFRHEADTLARLRHPGIGQIYELGTGYVWYNGVPTHARPFFVMERAHGDPTSKSGGRGCGARDRRSRARVRGRASVSGYSERVQSVGSCSLLPLRQSSGESSRRCSAGSTSCCTSFTRPPPLDARPVSGP